MMGDFGSWGWGWGMGFGWIIPLIIVGLIVWGVVAVTRSSRSGGGDRALTILKERYARGEIDRETYASMRRALEWPPAGRRLRCYTSSRCLMPSTLFILNDPPYGTERSYNALRLAGSLARREGEKVRLFLIGDAAACAKAGQRVPKVRAVAVKISSSASASIKKWERIGIGAF